MASLPATEWSSTFEGSPPEQLAPKVNDVVGLVRSLAGPGVPGGSIAVPDRPRVVTIFGNRGTGKSTVLQFALHSLRSNPDCLVLPVIDPEGFARGDSLGGWALEHLRNALDESERAYQVDPATTLGALLEDVARAQAVRSSAFLPGLEQRGLTLEDFGRDAVKVPRRSVQLGSSWSHLLDAVAQARSRPTLQVVVAVDDADLAPELLPDIVNNAQLIGASARSAIVFAAAEGTLRQALEIGLIASHGATAASALQHGVLTVPDVRALVSRRLVKSFPRSLRVRLSPLHPRVRLSFAPLGAGSALRQILERIPLPVDGFERLLDMFVIQTTAGKELEPSEHVLCLSENPRDLRQLHEALSHVDPQHEHAAAHALQVILQHGLDTVGSELPAEWPEPWTIVEGDSKPGILFDLGEVNGGKTVGSGVVIYRRADDPSEQCIQAPTLVARRILEHYNFYTETDSNSSDGAPQQELEHRLGSQLSHLYYLAWESFQENASGTRVLENAGIAVRGLSLAGGTSWRGQVDDGTSSMSWQYWTVPDWESFSDYYVFNAGWGTLLSLVLHHEVRPGRFELVEFLALVHIRLVVATQATRRVPDELVQLTTTALAQLVEPEGWSSRREALASEVAADLRAQVERSRQSTIQRDDDFVSWVETLMPLLTSRLFVSPELSQFLFKLWESLVTPEHRKSAVESLATIAARHLESEVADADIELLSRMDPARAAPLREVRIQVTRERASERAEALSRLTSDGVPREAIKNLQTYGASRDVLVALLTARVPPDRMARIAELFPPLASDAPLDRATSGSE